MKVTYHSDESLGIVHESYRESRTEKSLRGVQMSAVKRDLARNNIVVLDSPAYIKGFRYQLHCEAKALATSYCLVHVMAPVAMCLTWNAACESPWDPQLLTQMAMRYEEPNEQNRWDSPLFALAYDESELPFADLWSTIVLKKGPTPNAATVLKPASGTNFLQELDKETQAVIQKIVAHQQLQATGGNVMVAAGVSVELPPRPVSIAQLQRIRRTYVTLNRMRTVDVERISPLFVDYLNRSLNNEESI
ncbi:hypothetical protein BABINDRAFT_160487 [Babjeviella inositovora NRRL Y-12698]|uniref:Chromatin associated protein KTI12 n=1 Tax=Babjeviella inositovora NRRL Y-12698 TaxID=984486 RepID=A0A1E3QTQ8_9ASCO|nr:uncharacterized protein BABINDRAFT_160487 [Babjeviella inositovora NRRL Y-12698]ODQ81076.1 hypothetical protein BABINDRAFT_160487 [Babjeviella inositovora NRRL Y-12698]